MKTRINRAVYPGTFDPITRGHEDLVRRASSLFDEMIVAVADSRGKRPFFDVEERVEMAREALAGYPNVRIEGFSGLLMEFLRKHDAKIILCFGAVALSCGHAVPLCCLNVVLIAIHQCEVKLRRCISTFGGFAVLRRPPITGAETGKR